MNYMLSSKLFKLKSSITHNRILLNCFLISRMIVQMYIKTKFKSIGIKVIYIPFIICKFFFNISKVLMFFFYKEN